VICLVGCRRDLPGGNVGRQPGEAVAGSFIDGQIVGRVTDVWWAVKFPIIMAALGLALLYRSRLRRMGRLLLFCLTIPSNWTQDIPARYGKRHTGLQHSWLYPQIDTAAPARPGSAIARS
jgi:hypothetical protein